MSWNYRELDQREEITALKEQLAVLQARSARCESEKLKAESELEEFKGTLVDTTNKFRHGESEVLRLEKQLKQRTEDYNREKFDRENQENALSKLKEELKCQATLNRDAQSTIEQLTRDNSGSSSERLKAIQEKAKLENQIRELQGELRNRPELTLQAVKPSRRPRSSSLTNFRVATLEDCLAQATNSSAESQAEVDRLKASLSKARNGLIRVENEKRVLEKKNEEKGRLLKDATDDLAHKDEALEFLQRNGAASEREAELIARIEEEEAKSQLLEQQWARVGRDVVSKRSFAELEERLVNITIEKETAQRELHEATDRQQQTDEDLKTTQATLKEVERENWILRDQIYALKSKPAQSAEEGAVSQLKAAVVRLRAERDDARRSLEFIQTESRFTIDALRNDAKLSTGVQLPTILGSTNKKLGLLSLGLAVTVQRMESQNADFVEQCNRLSDRADHQAEKLSALLEERDSLNQQNAVLLASISSNTSGLEGSITSAFDVEDVEMICTSHAGASASDEVRDEELGGLRACLANSNEELGKLRAERDSYEQQIRTLEENLASVQRDLQDSEDRCCRLQATHITDSSGDDRQTALKEEIKVLETRVLRRTEQIGIHQHDIKRLETNMRLAEERLGELSSELEMASTEKEAMVEDCATAREERDDAKRLAIELEGTVDDLTREVSEKATEISTLQQSIFVLKSDLTAHDEQRAVEIATLISVIMERQNRLEAVSRQCALLHVDVRNAKTGLKQAEAEIQLLNASRSNDVAILEAKVEAHDTEVAGLRDIMRHNEDALIGLEMECKGLREANERLQNQATEADSTSGRVFELELESETLRSQNGQLQTEINDWRARVASLEEETERTSCTHDSATAKFANEIASLKQQLALRATDFESVVKTLKDENEQLSDEFEATKVEFENFRLAYETQLSSQKAEAAKASDELESRINELLGELDALRDTFGAEQREVESTMFALEAKIQCLSQENERILTSGASSQQQLQSYQIKVTDLTGKLEEALAEKSKLKGEVDDLAGKTQRAITKSDSIEKQLLIGERNSAALEEELAQLRGQLAQSETTARTSEMNLLLVEAEHKRIISGLRNQLSELERGEAQLAELQRSNNELQSQVAQMEGLLRDKCAEIEENDDKFIELLKEKKKLSSKVDSLTKKVANLQSKIEKRSKSPSPPSISSRPESNPPSATATGQPSATHLQTNPRAPLAMRQAASLSLSDTYGQTSQPFVFKALPQSLEQEPRPVQPDLRRDDKENRQLPPTTCTNGVRRMEASTSLPTPSAGKKRRAPDDDETPSLPPAAMVADVETSSGVSFFESLTNPQAGTPGFRRHIQAFRNGFTPSRTQGARPVLDQPSPIRKGTSVTTAAIHDARNSPRRVVSTQARSRVGWLGKIRGGTGNALNLNNLGRTSRQASTEDLLVSDNLS